ncbi:MAG: glycosyltransferase family 2 protein [Lachnospiraceae bacterium]|nr:glycosyltransferase family 2 protein [Lachnospiraceae bacterium]
MKLLSVAIPCYNSAEYMEHCVNTLLTGGEELEIIIVDDGSTDDTAKIADRLASEHPAIIKAIHQENGGHGEAVNTGLRNATGEYFKVVDSDDWVDEKALQTIVKTLRYMVDKQKGLDMLLSNFVYEKQGVKNKAVMNYRSAIKPRHITSWDGNVHFKISQYILMHSVIYRTEMLRDCGLELPKHTFYVDNIYVFKPLPYVKKVCYIDVDFYRYFIGREGQSVNEKVMISRIDQHIRVAKIMIEEYSNMDIKSKNLDKYMLQYLDMMMCIASIMLIRAKTKEALVKKKELWNWLKKEYPDIYKKLRFSIFGISMNLPGKVGRLISVTGYKIANKVFGFN